MAKSFYVSKLVQETSPFGSVAYVPRVMQQMAAAWTANQGNPDYNYAVRVFLPNTPTSTGVGSFAVCIADCINQVDAAADANNQKMPDLTLDSPLGSNWTTQVRNKLQNWGFDTTGINSTTTLGDALQILADQIKPGWNRFGFDTDKPNMG